MKRNTIICYLGHIVLKCRFSSHYSPTFFYLLIISNAWSYLYNGWVCTWIMVHFNYMSFISDKCTLIMVINLCWWITLICHNWVVFCPPINSSVGIMGVYVHCKQCYWFHMVFWTPEKSIYHIGHMVFWHRYAWQP